MARTSDEGETHSLRGGLAFRALLLVLLVLLCASALWVGAEARPHPSRSAGRARPGGISGASLKRLAVSSRARKAQEEEGGQPEPAGEVPEGGEEGTPGGGAALKGDADGDALAKEAAGAGAGTGTGEEAEGGAAAEGSGPVKQAAAAESVEAAAGGSPEETSEGAPVPKKSLKKRSKKGRVKGAKTKKGRAKVPLGLGGEESLGAEGAETPALEPRGEAEQATSAAAAAGAGEAESGARSEVGDSSLAEEPKLLKKKSLKKTKKKKKRGAAVVLAGSLGAERGEVAEGGKASDSGAGGEGVAGAGEGAAGTERGDGGAGLAAGGEGEATTGAALEGEEEGGAKLAGAEEEGGGKKLFAGEAADGAAEVAPEGGAHSGYATKLLKGGAAAAAAAAAGASAEAGEEGAGAVGERTSEGGGAESEAGGEGEGSGTGEGEGGAREAAAGGGAKERLPETVEASEKEDSGNSGVAQEMALVDPSSEATAAGSSAEGGGAVPVPGESAPVEAVVSVGAPEQLLIEQAALEDEEDYASFMSELFSAGQRLPVATQALKEKAEKHVVPKMQELARTGHEAFRRTSAKIESHVTPIFGPSVSPLVATILSFSLLLLPLALIAALLYQVRFILTLQRLLVLCNLYLFIYCLALLFACIIMSGEPMRSLRVAAEPNFYMLQLVEACGYLMYLILQMWWLLTLCRAKPRDRDSILISKAVLQLFVALGIGLHYYIFVFERALLDKAPKITASGYLVYSVLFLILTLIGRPQDSTAMPDKKT